MFKSIRITALSSSVILFLTTFIFGQTLMETSPENVGLSADRLNRINVLEQKFVDQQKMAGVVTLVARQGKIAHFNACGMQDMAGNKPMQRNTIFRLASMTKPIISVAVMTLYENGLFQLDDPVSKYIPEFKQLKVYSKELPYKNPKREMTIIDLLRHTAGLTYGFGQTPVDSLYNALKVFDFNGTLKDMIDKLARIPLLDEPGERWNYSIATDVLGYLIEVISRKPLDQYLQETLFNPLEMKDTGFFVSQEKLDRVAILYKPTKDGRLTAIEPTIAAHPSQRPSFLFGGGGLLSTATDYLRFSQMLLNEGELDGRRILGKKTVELMTMNHLRQDLLPLTIELPEHEWILAGHGFGLGFRVLCDMKESASLGSLGSYGWCGAFGTFVFIDPREKLIGLLMTQIQPPPWYPSVREYQVLMYQSIIE